jgi:N-methylhydantoinase B
MHVSESATRVSPVEIWEARNPWLVERLELAVDSCGPGRHRGGLGLELEIRLLEDAWVTAVIERTTTPPWGLEGGGEARPNAAELRLPDGARRTVSKATRLSAPRGAVFELRTGGGGGWGPAAERDPAAVERDLAEGYVTAEHARTHYGARAGSGILS